MGTTEIVVDQLMRELRWCSRELEKQVTDMLLRSDLDCENGLSRGYTDFGDGDAGVIRMMQIFSVPCRADVLDVNDVHFFVGMEFNLDACAVLAGIDLFLAEELGAFEPGHHSYYVYRQPYPTLQDALPDLRHQTGELARRDDVLGMLGLRSR